MSKSYYNICLDIINTGEFPTDWFDNVEFTSDDTELLTLMELYVRIHRKFIPQCYLISSCDRVKYIIYAYYLYHKYGVPYVVSDEHFKLILQFDIDCKGYNFTNPIYVLIDSFNTPFILSICRWNMEMYKELPTYWIKTITNNTDYDLSQWMYIICIDYINIIEDTPPDILLSRVCDRQYSLAILDVWIKKFNNSRNIPLKMYVNIPLEQFKYIDFLKNSESLYSISNSGV